MKLMRLAALLLVILRPGAPLELPSYWSSSMVIQRDVPFTLWGVDQAASVVTVSWRSNNFKSSPADTTGRFEVHMPAANVSTTPSTLTISSSTGDKRVLTDVLVGDVYVCSGQSNMQLAVRNTAEYSAILAAAGGLGATLRIFQVAMLPEYVNATTPQNNLTASIPWSRASAASVPGMSAFCYNFGVSAVTARPDVPIGMQATSWGGVAIQVFMSPAAMAQCPHAVAQPTLVERLAAATAPDASNDDVAFGALAAAEIGPRGLRDSPHVPSCLYHSMLHPLQSLSITGVLWYQGESNAGDPLGYQCMQRAMIADWRASWALVGSLPTLPFVFAQISGWPTGGQEFIPIFRVAVEKTLTDLPRVGMVVSADIADPAGAYHPIHPPWKAELVRRAWLWADNVVYGNTSSPASGPRVVSVTWDAWNATWGDYHHGTGGASYVCGSATGPKGWTCAGVRVRFDQPIVLRNFYSMDPPDATLHIYDFNKGAASGFELWASNPNIPGKTWFQPATLTGLADAYTAQLNVTWIGPGAMVDGKPTPVLLKYAWSEYPHAMPITNTFGLPAGPFNATITT